MPVVGHAFVGLATAVQFEPAARRDGRPLAPLAVAGWAPAVVALSYLPDVVTQVGSTAGWTHAGLFGHSAAVAVAGGALVGALWARASGISARRLVTISIGAMLGHDLLDLLQSTDRAPFWPWWNRIITTGASLLPTGIAADALLFAILFALFVAWRTATGRSLGSLITPPAGSLGRATVWMFRGAAAALIVAAVVAHAVREGLERQLETAERLVSRGRFVEALHAADLADGGWISSIKPGRVDVVRAEAYEGLGDSARAEALYLTAYQKDPTNFWAAVDLVEHFASCDRPLAERRRLAQPYLEELRSAFATHRDLPAILSRIDKKLLSE